MNREDAFRPSVAVDISHLHMDQKWAFNIISTHVMHVMQGAGGNQLLMLLLSEGGTGKSIVISTLTSFFLSRGRGNMLVKGAYTGIAACHIGGCTLHTLVSIPQSDHDMPNGIKLENTQSAQ